MARDTLTGIEITDVDYLNVPDPPPTLPGGPWSGRIARLRIYEDGRIFAYKHPGTNSDYVGYTTDLNFIKTLFLARDNGAEILGYTNSDYTIGLIDY